MIDFRYHLVSLVAVFLALALGLFIGSTELQPKVAGDLRSRTASVAARNNDLEHRLTDAQSQLGRDDAFASSIEPYVLPGQLSGASVVVVSAPHADGGMRSDLEQALAAAGATVAADVQLSDKLLDPGESSFLSALCQRIAGRNRRPAASGNERALALLAGALGARSRGPAGATTNVLDAFDAAGLVSVTGANPGPGSVGLVVAGAAPTSGDLTAVNAQQQLLAGFAARLDTTTDGVVVAGPSTSNVPQGLVGVVRADASVSGAVSTVDTADRPSGVIAAVLALAEQIRGGAGSYGTAGGADTPVPSPSPTS